MSGIAWSPDGEELLAHSTNSMVRIWKSRTGAPTQSLSTRKAYGSDRHALTDPPVAWSPDGRYIAAGGNPSTAWVWDVVTGEAIRRLDSRQVTTTIGLEAAVAWSPDGRRIAYGSNDTGVRIWSADTGQLLRTLDDSGSVDSVAWSPDNERIVADDQIWNVNTGSRIRTLGTRWVTSAAWSPDGRHIAIAERGETVRIFNSEHRRAGVDADRPRRLGHLSGMVARRRPPRHGEPRRHNADLEHKSWATSTDADRQLAGELSGLVAGR